MAAPVELRYACVTMPSRARNKLTVREIHSAKVGIHSDGGNLYLRVRSNGRSWFFIGTIYGKRFEMGLGSVQDVSLSMARAKATEARAQLLEGHDPRLERDKAKLMNRPAIAFGAFAEEYITSIESGFKNPKNAQQWRNTIATHAAFLMNIPVSDVGVDHVVAVLQPIWHEKAETASRLRGRIEKVLDAAKVRGLRTGENPARLRGNLDLLLPHRRTRVRHHPALPYPDLPAFLQELRSKPAMSARALEFLILTAARSGEVRGMTWNEIDLKSKCWTVSAERMKSGKAHHVPLSDATLSVLNTVRHQNSNPSDFVFVAPRGGSFSDMALGQLLKRMGYPDITVHGFRSTFRDWAGDTTQFDREVVEMALAHTVQSAVERAYRRGTALAKRRRLMTAWAEFSTGESTCEA
tara:strand:+ start:2499 stop:3725 length:1227 start_codon:yes stop_codon:yes gene_type:complete